MSISSGLKTGRKHHQYEVILPMVLVFESGFLCEILLKNMLLVYE